MIYDASPFLWVITWPSGKLCVYTFVHQALRRANVIHKLTPDMQAAAKQVVPANTKNKIQLNVMLTEGILDPGYFTEATQTHTFSIAGVRDVPVEITDGLRIERHDLRPTHEEAEYPNRTTRYLVITLRQVCSCCVRRHRRFCPTRSLIQ